MADSNIAVTPGSGANVDTRTEPGGDHRQVIVIGDPATADTAKVSTGGGLQIQGLEFTPTTTTIGAGATGTLGPVDVSHAGNVTFAIYNSGTAFTGSPVVVFEQSIDGTNWGPLNVVRADTMSPVNTLLLSALAANTALIFDAAAEGIIQVRMRVTTGTATGSLGLGALPGGGFFEPSVATVERNNSGRTQVNMYLSAVTAGTTATEAIQTLTFSRGTNATSSGTTFPISNGKTLRITGIRFQHMGHATATTASVVWRIRLNTGGAAIVTSTPIILVARTATPATSLAKDAYDVGVSEGFEIVNPTGGTVNIALTATPTFVTNAPTYDFHLVGYEY